MLLGQIDKINYGLVPDTRPIPDPERTAPPKSRFGPIQQLRNDVFDWWRDEQPYDPRETSGASDMGYGGVLVEVGAFTVWVAAEVALMPYATAARIFGTLFFGVLVREHS